jgi:hypothetical protein
VNVAEGEVETVDSDLKRAQLVKIYSEAAIAIVTVLIYAQFLVKSDVKDRLKMKWRRWRTEMFGAPPLTEDQIKEAARQVNIEAAQILRSAE